MNAVRFSLTISLFFLLILQVSGQESTSTLTLDRAVAIALQHNTTVVQAANNYEASKSSTTAAIGGLLPTVDAGYSFTRSQQWKDQPGFTVVGDQVIENPGFGASNSQSLGVSGRLMLFNGLANYNNVSRARASEASTGYALDRTRQQVVYQTHQLFLNVVRTSQLLTVADDNLKRSKQQLERITESNKVGAVALADVYREQVQVGNDEIARIQALNNFENAKADLISFLGITTDKVYTFDIDGVPRDIDTTEFGPLNARYQDVEKLVATALNTRPDYQSSVQNANAANSSVLVARAGHLPSVSASSSYGYSGYENVAGSSPVVNNRGLSFSINVSWPIFSGFSVQNQIEQAKVGERNAVEQKQQLERQIRVDIHKALLDLEAWERQVQVAQTTVTSAKLDRQIAEEKYNLGAGTLLDLLVATANYTNALGNKVNAVTGYMLSRKEVELALGTISQ